ncbi:hypothetical protein BDK51DRAFT_47286 [Blyttiomyces helicus]|uniref:Uncharacterized protein n=1 Tax=Blyttiomyces helicus TaxID=388810 RepID=A0A4P9W411_9FUNG|nr:hypothetical protein BDK51DRAFT_47286 [Blyttiomyces helicus]|eukprot:RKO85558.1 hypothetical protein BDK51DRAFT_47286 [Blyttiomyces helicus]
MSKGGAAIEWKDHALAKSCYTSYMKLYKSASERMKSQTGYGLTVDEHRKGVTTLEKWCEGKCPYHGRLGALFGERQNKVADAPLLLGYGDPFASETAAPIDVLANLNQTGGSSSDLRDLKLEMVVVIRSW